MTIIIGCQTLLTKLALVQILFAVVLLTCSNWLIVLGDNAHSATHAEDVVNTNVSTGGVTDTYTNDMFTLLTNTPPYNKWVPPQHIRPLRVNISILLFGTGSIDEVRTEFNLQLLMRISWFDERLCPWGNTKIHNVTTLEGGSWHMDRLWKPSIHVPNSKVPDILQDKSQNPVLARIQSDGQILISKRINLAGNSNMDFRLYPMDTQSIRFEIESNELSSENLKIYWRESFPFDTTPDFNWDGYDMIDYKLKRATSNYTHTGMFSKVVATFYLHRVFGQILIDVYVPIILYVATSWCSFWIEITAAPARVTLGVTIMLTMVTTSRSARDKLPPVPYIHTLDIWITVSIIFVFASLVEYTYVNYIYFREKRAHLKKMKRMKSKRKHEQRKKGKMACNNSSSSSTRKNSSIYLDNNNNNNNNLSCHIIYDPNYNNNLTQLNNNSNHNNKEKDHQKSSSNINKSKYFLPTQSDKSKSNRLESVMHFLCCLFTWNKDSIDDYDSDNNGRTLEGCEEIAIEIDRLSRMLFPLSYFIFNIIYWMVIVIRSQHNFD